MVFRIAHYCYATAVRQNSFALGDGLGRVVGALRMDVGTNCVDEVVDGDLSVRQAESLAARMRGLADDDPEYARLTTDLQAVVDAWTEAVRSLGLEAKGPWLVDFDNGEGYYCWCYPEPSVSYYHCYDEGFAGRTRIQ